MVSRMMIYFKRLWQHAIISLLLAGSCYASSSSAYSEYLQNSILEIGSIVQYVAIGMGIGLMLGGLFKLKKYGQMRTMMSHQLTLATPLGMMIAGSALLILPTFTGTMERAVWGADWYSTVISLDTSGDWTGLIKPVLMLVRLLGVIALIRGIGLMTKASGQAAQPGAAGKALMHFIAGILCVNINGTVDILSNIFDFSSIF